MALQIISLKAVRGVPLSYKNKIKTREIIPSKIKYKNRKYNTNQNKTFTIYKVCHQRGRGQGGQERGAGVREQTVTV